MLVQIMVVVGIMSSMLVASLNIIQNLTGNMKSTQAKSNLLSQKILIQTIMSNPNSWNATINHATNNTTFNCLLNPNIACSMDNRFKLIKWSGEPFFPLSWINTGYTLNGNGCSSFNQNNGTNDCPFGVEFRWRRVCGNPCINPMAEVTVDFSYSPADDSFPYNVNNLDFTMISSGLGSSSLLTSNSFDWTDTGGLLMIGLQPVQLREYEFDLQVPIPSVFTLSTFTQAIYDNSTVDIEILSSVSAVYINDQLCSRNRVSSTSLGSANYGQVGSAATCIEQLSVGTYAIKVTASGWVNKVARPDFTDGQIGYMLLAQ